MFHPIFKAVFTTAVLSVSSFAQPTISNITNAAYPGIDTPPNEVRLAPRSIATIFGTGLADTTVAIAPPWQKLLGGTEVHFIVSTVNGANCALPDCEYALDLLYVSPTQINFMTPNIQAHAQEEGRIVLVRDGVRFDARFDLLPPGPGLMIEDSGAKADTSVVFEVGFDCLYSLSSDPVTSCGVSWSPGNNRVPLGAITDPSGDLISSSNPVHQGEIVTLWMTGLPGLELSEAGGAYTVSNPSPIGFGISQDNRDILTTVAGGFDGEYTGAFLTPTPLFAGESPQFPGLDQVNVAFPTCPSKGKASTAQRFDAWLVYTSPVIGTTLRLYFPFVVRPGDSNCDWSPSSPPTMPATSTSMTASLDETGSVTFTATVTPSIASGKVDFLDGSCTSGCILIGTAALAGGVGSFSGALSEGPHSISAQYEGNGYYASSSSPSADWIGTSASIVSSVNPAKSGEPITFTATFLPSNVSGTVDFVTSGGLPVECSGGAVYLVAGTAICNSPGLISGTFSISAVYRGNSNSKLAGSSASLTETVQ